MRKPTLAALRKWAIGIGCTLSVAVLFQQAKESDAFQKIQNIEPQARSGAPDSPEMTSPQQEDGVMDEWQSHRRRGGGLYERGGDFGQSETETPFRSRTRAS